MVDTNLEDKKYAGGMNKQILRRIATEIWKYWYLLIPFFVCIIITAFIDAYATYLSKGLIDEGILAGNRSTLFRYGYYIALTFLLNAVSIFFFIFCAGRMGERVQHDLRSMVFNHLQEQSLSFFDKNSSAWLLSRIVSDSRRVAELCSWMLLDVIWGISNITIALFFMARINLMLSLILLFILPLLVFVAVIFRKLLVTEYRKVRSVNAKITASYSESLNGIRIIKALVKEGLCLKTFSNLTHDMYHASFRATRLAAIFLPIVQLIISLTVGVILLFGGWQIELGSLTIGGLRAFIGYATFMLWPIENLARVFSEMQHSLVSAERVFGLLDTKSTIQDRVDAKEDVSLKGSIGFENVDFHYSPESPILKNFNLNIQAGETIALVGPTGGGKTTIISLLSRYYEPVAGRILMDDEDFRNFTQKALQSRIALVLQKPQLFSGTVKENIRYGRPNADDDDVFRASKLACADRMILNLPNGYAQEVGEGGELLSMGQRQLISLARAILAQPDILVMDEATSSVDTLTEGDIQNGLAELLRGRTSLIVAHRLSTIRRADRILFIRDGRIIEDGSHQELLKQQGAYFHLYTRQFRQETSHMSLLG